MTSCNPKNSAESEETPFDQTLSADDTTKVLALAENCMQQLKAGNVEAAINSIYFIDVKDNTLVNIPDSVAARLKAKYKKLPVIDYHLDKFTFEDYDNNEVRYRIQIVPDQPDVTMALGFNPVKLNGEWFLTMKGVSR